jgi:MFS family permease
MHEANQFALLKIRRFAPFFCTQFFGAFNDNVLKNALIIVITFQSISWSALSISTLVNLCAGLFILPFFLFSATAGQIADRLEKSRFIRWIKFAEVLIMVLACIGFYYHQLAFLLAVLFLLGTQATFFGPVKYSILPQHLHEDELIGGNGLVEMGTFVAILLGTICAAVLMGFTAISLLLVSTTLLVCALSGWGVSWFIPKAPPNDPQLKISWNIVEQTWHNIQFARENRTVFYSILANSWFWFYGTVYITQLPPYCKLVLGGNEHLITVLLIMFSVGVGLGALLCEKLSGRKIEIGLVPFGSMGLTLFAIVLYLFHPTPSLIQDMSLPNFLASPQNWGVLASLLSLGVFGGLYIVPLYAVIQYRSDDQYRSRIIAANNILNALFMGLASLFAVILLALGVTIPQLFLLTGLINAVLAVTAYTLIPEFWAGFVAWIKSW